MKDELNAALTRLKEGFTGEKLKQNLKKALQFIANPRLLLCFFVGWMITNGWSYILFGVGTYLEIDWMMAVSGAYLTLLWLPFTPEKIITCAIAIALLRWLFPGDQKTLAVLHAWHEKAREPFRNHRAKKNAAETEDERQNEEL